MSVPPMYHAQSRELQDLFDTRRLADRLVEKLVRARFTEEDRAFIEKQSMFFLATADAEGYPDCSYKGGAPGFVRMLDETTLAFPSYDGNGMFKSLGNLRSNPRVGLLFLNFEKPRRYVSLERAGSPHGRTSLNSGNVFHAGTGGVTPSAGTYGERSTNCMR